MKNKNGFLSFLSSLLSLALAVLLIVAIPVGVIVDLFSDEKIDILVDQILGDIDTSDLGIKSSLGNKSMAETLLYIIKDCPGTDSITEEQAAKELVPIFIRSFISDFISDFTDSETSGSPEIAFDPDDIYTFFANNSQKISDLASNSTVDIKSNKRSIMNNINDVFGEDGVSVDSLIEDDGIKDSIDSYISAAHTLLSLETLKNAACVVGAILFLLLLVNIGHFGDFLSACGTPALVIGVIYFILAFIVGPFLSEFIIPSENFYSAFNFAIGLIAAITMDISCTVLIAGIVLIILAAIAKAIARKKSK